MLWRSAGSKPEPGLADMSSPIVKLVAQRIALGIILLLAVSVLIFA
ncbi:MAG: ABC transporter permease, partial [Mesorhizobium sp.]